MQDEAHKADVAHRFRRLYILHHVILAWSHEARRIRIERRERYEDEQRRAKVLGFLSRIAPVEGGPQRGTGEGLVGLMTAGAAPDPPAVGGPPGHSKHKGFLQGSPAVGGPPGGGQQGLKGGGPPRLATAARAEAKRRSLLAAAAEARVFGGQGSSHGPSGPTMPPPNAEAVHPAEGTVGQAEAVHAEQWHWKPGETYKMVQGMKRQLKERPRLDTAAGMPSAAVDLVALAVVGGAQHGSNDTMPDVQAGQIGMIKAMMDPAPIQETALDQSKAPEIQDECCRSADQPPLRSCEGQLPATGHTRKDGPFQGRAADSKPASSSDRPGSASSVIRPGSRSTSAHRRATTGCIPPGSPASSTGAAVGVVHRNARSSAGSRRQTGSSVVSHSTSVWASGCSSSSISTAMDSLSRIRAMEAQQKRKMAVSAKIVLQFGAG